MLLYELDTTQSKKERYGERESELFLKKHSPVTSIELAGSAALRIFLIASTFLTLISLKCGGLFNCRLAAVGMLNGKLG